VTIIAALIERVDIDAMVRLYRICSGAVAVHLRSPRAPTSSLRLAHCSACWSSTRCPDWASSSRATSGRCATSLDHSPAADLGPYLYATVHDVVAALGG
jgi:hypothetical protein